jgi:uncharacterized membrane protein YqjE
MTESSATPGATSSVVASPSGAGSVPRPERRSEPPLQDTLVDLWENISKLLQQEIALAKVELGEKAQRLKAELLGSIAGAALLLAGLLAVVAAVILLLARVMPDWLAALLTGVAAGGGGYLLLAKLRPSVADITPERTAQNLKKDIQTFTEARR